MLRTIIGIFIALFLVGCASNRYVITESEYSVWKGAGKDKEMYLRTKTMLLDTKTGESWGYEYNHANKGITSGGYGWVKIPVSDKTINGSSAGK